MAKKLAPVEVNSFIGGLVSDANALTFPPNASLDEVNMVLNSDGSRNRRLGMDFENSSVEVTTGVSFNNSPAHTTFKWENVGGDPGKNLLVVQFGNEIKFFDFDNMPLSSSVIYTHTFEPSSNTQLYSYTSVDGVLVVATGLKEITKFIYEEGAITVEADYLRIRDLFGVEDKFTPGGSSYIISGVVSQYSDLPISAENNSIFKVLNGTAITSDDTMYKYSSGSPGSWVITTYNAGYTLVTSLPTITANNVYVNYDSGSGVNSYVSSGYVAPSWSLYTPTAGSNPSIDLKEGNNTSYRPNSSTDSHIYNLRNQSWGKSLVCVTKTHKDDLTEKDPVYEFYKQVGKFPSNADSTVQGLYPDANLASNRTINRFNIEDIEKTPIGSTQTASGYFVIDALERGTSRLAVYAEMMSKYPKLSVNISTLPLDKTPGGPTVVAQFAGRVWYSGFSGNVIEGDKKSPKLSSYVMFSQLVEDLTDMTKCYQDGDPTSQEDPDLLDTDGGFIRIDEAYGIKALAVSGNSLFVLATNGVWRITGGAKDEGFTATNYSVGKITTTGCRAHSSVITAEGSVLFWGDDGIYIISPNEFGDWVAKNLVQNKLQNFYNNISSLSKESAQGFYDSYEHKVRWVYESFVGNTGDTKELVLDLQIGSFSTNSINPISGGLPKLVGIYESPPFRTIPGTDNVTVSVDSVVVGSSIVISGTQIRQSSTKEIGYIVITSTTDTIKYRFASYKDTKFLDWKSYNGAGIDAEAYILTGYLSAGDFQRQKVVPMLTIYLNKTETGFELDAEGDFTPTNPSSCKVQVQWEWTNSANSNRWGKEFQAYRHRKPYFPNAVSDSFDNGYEVVVTKNKIRGKGRVLSILYKTEPLKDLHLLGWSFMLGILTDV